MKTFLLLLLFFLISPIMEATEQIPELLSLDRAHFEIEEFPLETHTEYEKIIQKLKENSNSLCSASWRGYRGIWAIKEGNFWLMYVKVNPCSDDPKFIYPENIFNQKSNLTFADWYTHAILADWYTGTITFRISEYTCSKKDSIGRRSGCEYEAVVYHIKNGKVASRSIEKIR